MLNLTNKRFYLIGGFIAIVIVYSLYNIYLVDVNYYNQIPRKLRHINRFLSILIVYGIGTYALKKYTVNWMMLVWHALHVVVIFLLLLLGVYDWTFGQASVQVRNMANTFHEFLISPIFYVAMVILSDRLLFADYRKLNPQL